MGKRFCSKLSLVASLLLVFQLVFPMVNAMAATDPDTTPILGGIGSGGISVPETGTNPETKPSGLSSASATTSSLSAATTGALLPPSNLAAALTTPDTVKLTWSSVFGATGYNVYGIIDGQLQRLATTTATTYTFPGLKEGDYQYVVTTNGSDGESGPNAPVSVTITYPKMEAPATLTYKVQNANDIVLNWAASQYATSYNIYQVAADGSTTLVTSVSGKTTYTFAQQPAGSYTYAVSAVNTLYGESPISVTTKVDLGETTQLPPGNFAYKVQNGNDIVLTWSASQYATGYNVYQVINGQKVLQKTVTTTSVTFTNQPAGDYAYVVTSYGDRFGESADSSQVSFTLVLPVMTAPANFKATLSNINDVNLSWTTVPNASGYKIYQVANGQNTLIKTVTGATTTSTSFTNQPAGDITYEIHSYSDRFGESTDGSTVTVTVTTPTMTAPQEFAYNITNGNDLNLSWASVPNATSYKIYQVIGDQKVLKTTTSSLTVTYSNMPAGDYTYEIHSFSTRFGESTEFSTVQLTLVLPVMAAPANVVQSVTSATSFKLNWDPAANATSYKVYQVTNGQKVLKSTVSTTSVSYTNMTPGDYTFEVHSYSSRFGESAEGTTLTFTLTDQTQPAPTNLTYTVTNGNDITLKWTAAQYATSYKVYQVVDGQNVLLKTVTGTSISFTNQPGGVYDYLVTAVSSTLGESEAAVTNFTLTLPTVLSPTNLTSKIQNGNDVVLTWSAATYANSYKIYEVIGGQEVLKTTVTGLTATLSKVSAGDHVYSVHTASTRFGESVTGSTVTVTLDATTMQPPMGLTQTIVNGNDIQLKWTAATYATAYNIYLIQDGVPVLQKTVTGTTYTFTNQPAGDYTYAVFSYSDRFGESMDGSQVSLSLVFPTMQAPANFTQSITNGNDIVLKWNASTYANSYNVYQVSGGVKTLVKNTTAVSLTLTNQPEGNYTFEVHSVSTRFGESPEGSTLNFQLVWPVVAPPTLTSSVVNANNVTLTWKSVQWANEYRVYQVNKDGSKTQLYKGTALTYTIYNLAQDTFSYEVTAFATRFGESQPSNRETMTIVYPVMQAPVVTAKVLSTSSATLSWGFVTYANGYNIYEIVDGKQVLVKQNLNALSYTLTNLPYANHNYVVTSYSNSFGESVPSNVTFVKLINDTVPPVTTASAPADWTNQTPVTVTLSATDNDTGVDKTFVSLNDGAYVQSNSVTVSAEGINKVSYYSTDKVGNTETAKTIYVKIDKTAPVTTAAATKDWSNADVTVALTATDAGSGVAKTYYS
ncbi:OmpL47-type beta-barrel domain-containing protein, partial [Tumebacillus flagellatus]